VPYGTRKDILKKHWAFFLAIEKSGDLMIYPKEEVLCSRQRRELDFVS